MELKERMDDLKTSLDRASQNVRIFTEEYNRLTDSSQPTTQELYKNIHLYITVTVFTNKTYTHILGGDGRSAPWDEERKGKVVAVKVNDGIYLSSEQVKVVKAYVNTIHEPDHLTIK